jgi:hypothetical protein
MSFGHIHKYLKKKKFLSIAKRQHPYLLGDDGGGGVIVYIWEDKIHGNSLFKVFLKSMRQEVVETEQCSFLCPHIHKHLKF